MRDKQRIGEISTYLSKHVYCPERELACSLFRANHLHCANKDKNQVMIRESLLFSKLSGVECRLITYKRMGIFADAKWQGFVVWGSTNHLKHFISSGGLFLSVKWYSNC